MRMQRKWGGGVLFSLFSLLLAGCGSGGDGDASIAPAPPASGPVGWNEVEGLHGLWSGMSSTGRAVWGAVVDNQYFFWYSAIGDPTVLSGGLNGTFDFDSREILNGVLASSDARDFSVGSGFTKYGKVTGTYGKHQTMTFTFIIIENLTERKSESYALIYQPNSGSVPGSSDPDGLADMALIIGTYTGTTQWSPTPPTITISPDGVLRSDGPWFEPEPITSDRIYSQYWGAKAYEFTHTPVGLVPFVAWRGAAVFDATTNKLFLFAMHPFRDFAFIDVITKQ